MPGLRHLGRFAAAAPSVRHRAGRLRAWGSGGVDQQAGLVHLAGQQRRPGPERMGDAVLDQRALLGRGLFQHPVDDLAPDPGVAYAYAQAPVVGAAQLPLDVAQAVVPRMAPAALELDRAGGNVEFVVHHQDFLGLELEKARQRSHRLARVVHESLRLQQPNALPMHRRAGQQGLLAALWQQRGLEFTGQRIDQPETAIVAGGRVVWPRVAQAGKQLYHLRNGHVGLGPGTWQRPAGAVAMWPEGAVGRAPRALDYFLALGFAAGLAAAAGLAVAAGLAALPLPLASATGAGAASATGASSTTTGGTTDTRAGLC